MSKDTDSDDTIGSLDPNIVGLATMMSRFLKVSNKMSLADAWNLIPEEIKNSVIISPVDDLPPPSSSIPLGPVTFINRSSKSPGITSLEVFDAELESFLDEAKCVSKKDSVKGNLEEKIKSGCEVVDLIGVPRYNGESALKKPDPAILEKNKAIYERLKAEKKIPEEAYGKWMSETQDGIYGIYKSWDQVVVASPRHSYVVFPSDEEITRSPLSFMYLVTGSFDVDLDSARSVLSQSQFMIQSQDKEFTPDLVPTLIVS